MKKTKLLTILTGLLLILFAGIYGKKGESGSSVNETLLSGLKFRSIGPAFMSGRIADIAIDQKDKKTWYIAVGSGGVWKTTNAGTTFKPIFDSELSYSIGCITIDPNNSNIIWVGSGENVSGRHVGYGDGVYKSEDGGMTWKNIGLKKSEHIDKIVINPTDSNIVFVAAEGPLWSSGGERGVYKSSDGGITWSASLTVDKDTGATDLVMDPKNSNTLYAAMHQRRRHVSALINGGPGSAIYKTTDGGKNWKKIVKGLPKEELGQIALAVSPMRSDVLYASVETSGRKITFYRSEDGGINWKKNNSYVTPGTGPHYYQELYASPHKFDKIYSMEINILVSNDGGKKWGKIHEDKKHGDNHAIAFDPSSPDFLLCGSDGGLYETHDSGKTWRFISNLPVTQFYRIAVDNDKPFYNVLGGTQDNCTQLGPSRTFRKNGIINDHWRITMGGDGYSCQFDPVNPNIMYCESQVGEMIRYDKRSGEEVPIKPNIEPGKVVDRWNWDSPVIVSPHSPKRLYFASQRLFRSDDRGDTWSVISGDLSKGLNRLEEKFMGSSKSIDSVWDNDAMSYYGNVVTISESPLVEGLIYCGTDDGLIQVTEDGGKNWRRIERFPGIPAGTFVNEVMASKHNKGTVYALFDNHKRGDFSPYILKSTDKGKNWTSLNGNIPKRHILWSIEQDHVNSNILFLGTEFGVFCTVDGGKRWIKMKGGLPNIAVRDLKIQKRENDLVLGTFGRGIYILDDYSALRNVNKEIGKSDFKLMGIKNFGYFNFIDASGGGEGHTYFSAKNPAYGTMFTYYLKSSLKSLKENRREREKELAKSGKDVPFPGWESLRKETREEKPKLIFQITDKKGNIIKRITAPAKKGLKRIYWDMRASSQNPVRLKMPTSSSPFSYSFRWRRRGDPVLPGKYYVQVFKFNNGIPMKLSEKMEFSYLPVRKLNLNKKEMEDISLFFEKISSFNMEMTSVSAVIRKLDEGISYLKKSLFESIKENGNLYSEILKTEKKLKYISNLLYGDSLKSRHSEPTSPGINTYFWRFSSKFLSVLRPVRDYDRKSFNRVRSMFAPIKKEVKLLKEIVFPKLLKRAKKAGAPWIPGFGLY